MDRIRLPILIARSALTSGRGAVKGAHWSCFGGSASVVVRHSRGDNANLVQLCSGRRFCSGDVRRTGRVKVWSEERGFGFIIPDAGGEDVFVHRSSLAEGLSISLGKVVSFDPRWDERRQKMQAANVAEASAGDAGGSGTGVDKSEAQVSTGGHVMSNGSSKSSEAEVHPVRNEPSVNTASASIAKESENAADSTAQPASRDAGLKHAVDEAVAAEVIAEVPLLKQLEKQTIEMQQDLSSQQQTLASCTDPAVPADGHLRESAKSVLPQIHTVEPLQIPQGVSVEEKVDLMAAHMEKLRLQSAQNQQFLVQGMYAMLQQQVAQNAKIERALTAIAERMGAPVPSMSESDAGIDFAPTPSLQGGTQEQAHESLTNEQREGPDQRSGSLEGTKTPGSGSSEEAKAPSSESSEDTMTSNSPKREPTNPSFSSIAEIKTPSSAPSSETRAGRPPPTPGPHPSQENNVSHPPSEEAKTLDSPSEETRTMGSQSVREDDNSKDQGDESLLVVSPRASQRRNGQRGWVASEFQMVGTFNDWSVPSEPMGLKGHRLVVRREAHRIRSGQMRREEFQILGDGSWEKRIYPAGRNEEIVTLRPGQPSAAAEGDGKNGGHGRNWAIEGNPGTAFLIYYDQQAKTVTCEVE